MTKSNDQLERFYTLLQNGTTVERFLKKYDKIFAFIRARGLTKDYRLGKGRVKALRDEVTPVARFVCLHAKAEDLIRFALNNTYPDCILCREDGGRCEVEVTVAQGRERFYLMSELNETGTARGFLGVPDHASRQEYDNARSHERRAYTTDEVLCCIQRAIEYCTRNKGALQGDILLIDAPMETLPSERWDELPRRLYGTEALRVLAFREVYVTGSSNKGNICLKIKCDSTG